MDQLLLDFITAHFDQVTGNTPENTGQCVGLVSVWMDILGVPHEWGDAKDLLNNADSSKFDIVKNDPNDLNQHPVPGDIFCWDSSWGNGAGHTGVVVAADGVWFDCFEQNNPGKPHIVHHTSYAGALGWLHPKQAPVVSQNTPQPAIDDPQYIQLNDDPNQVKFNVDGNWYERQALKGIITDKAIADANVVDLTDKKEKLANQVTALDGQIYSLNKQLTDCQNTPHVPSNVGNPAIAPDVIIPPSLASFSTPDLFWEIWHRLSGR